MISMNNSSYAIAEAALIEISRLQRLALEKAR